MNVNDEDFLEDRFGEFNHALLEEQVREYDLQKEMTFDKQYALKQIYFSKSIPEKVIAILKPLILAILEFSARQGMVLRDPNHQVRFLDIASYEQEVGKPLPPTIPLPASQLHFNTISRIYTITLVLPEKIQTNEEVINVTRTLFAKFMGDIYLNESVLAHDFYREANRYEEKEITVSLPDQLGVIVGNDFVSATLEEVGKAYAKHYRMNYKKQYTAIKQGLCKEWRQQWEIQKLKAEDFATIDQIFQDFLEGFRLHPENVISNLVEKIEKLNGQLHFILPHEMKAYHLFEEKSRTQYIQAAAHKIEEILAKIGLIEELTHQLSSPIDPDDLPGLHEQIRIQLKQLKTEGKVRIFLIPGMRLGPQLQAQAQQFPLRLMKLLPKTLPVEQWSKEIASMTKKYRNAIYQKIFETLVYLKHWIEAIGLRKNEVFLESEEYKIHQKLLKNFKFHELMLLQMQGTLGIAQDYSEILKLKPRHSAFPIQAFKKAWSYVCSSILIHRYYENMNQLSTTRQRFKGDKYISVIEQYVMQQMKRGVDYAPLSALLLSIYRNKKEEGLSFLLYMIHNPQASFQYALTQVMLPLPESDSLEEQHKQRLAILKKNCDFLIQVYEERMETDILPGRDY